MERHLNILIYMAYIWHILYAVKRERLVTQFRERTASYRTAKQISVRESVTGSSLLAGLVN